MTSPSSRWLLAPIALVFALASPVLAMSQRPGEAPMPAEAHPASSIADMEEAAGHILVLGPEITFDTTKGTYASSSFCCNSPSVAMTPTRSGDSNSTMDGSRNGPLNLVLR